MDLAGAPTLSGSSTAPAHARAADACVRLISAQTACEPALRAQWERLAQTASEPNPFFERWFAQPALEQFGSDANCQVLAHYTGEHLTGLLPLARPKRYYGYLVPHAATWLHGNAFCGAPLVARGVEQAFWTDILAFLDGAAGKALFLHLPELPAEGPLNRALDQVLEDTGRIGVTVDAGERAMLRSDLSPAAYYEGAFSTKRRKELRRLKKRLGECGELTFERMSGAEGVEQWVEDFLALEASGWKGEAGSALACATGTEVLFRRAMMAAAAAGKLERLAFRLDGKPIAMLANLFAPPGVFSFKTAFDEDFARFSPGLLLQIENLDLLDRSDVEWADSCAVEGHSMIERIWGEKRRIVSRNIAIGGPVRRAVFRALMAYETRREPAA